MKSSARISVALLSSLLIIFFSAFFFSQTTAVPDQTENFAVAFEEEPDLDHVCFYMTISNNQDSDDSFPLKPLLNRTSIDITKAEAKLWEEETYKHEVTNCKACEVESQRCIADNVTDNLSENITGNGTMQETCEPYSISIEDCGKCGNWTETKFATRWVEKPLTNTEKTMTDKNTEFRNQFEDIRLKSQQIKRYKLCYYFNQIPINPTTGKQGSYGFMYLDVKEKLYYDFEHSSGWNISYNYRRAILGKCSACSGNVTMFVLVNDSALYFGGTSPQYVWCNFTVPNYTATLGYLYYNDETNYACSNSADTGQVAMVVDEGNRTGYGSTDPSLVAWWTLNGTGDKGLYGNTLNNSGAPGNIAAKIGHGMSYDSDDYSYSSGQTLKDIAGNFTVLFWMKDDSSTINYETILGRGTWDNNGCWQIRKNVSGSDYIYFDIYEGVSYNTKDEYDDNSWHMLAFVWDNTYKKMSIFADGRLDKKDGSESSGAYKFQSYNANTYIAIRYGTNRKWTGSIDNVMIWNRSLSSDEIMAYYNNTVGSNNFSYLETEEPLYPQITIYAPLNNTYITKTIYFNVSTNENTSWCGYSLDSQENISMTQINETHFWSVNSSMSEGSHNVKFWCNNTLGKMGSSTTRYFMVDTIIPEISLTFPENGSRYNLTWINITGIASDNNTDTVRINDTNFGSNLGSYQNWNFTNTSIAKGSYSLKITANDSAGNEKSVEVHFSIGTWNITFNIYSGETGQNLTNVNVYCNNSWSGTINSYYTKEFVQGDYSCVFEKDFHFNNTIAFTADNDKVVDIKLSLTGFMSTEEHDWLEYLYDCWSSGNCRQTLDKIETMVVYINQTTTQINDTVNKVWDQFRQTDESVVLKENTTSPVVNATSNLTIEYSISVPVKQDYQFLPIRIFYWFLSEDNTTCYGQAKDSEDAESPYCKPLVAQAIGEANNVLNFTVELRPSLPAGNYNVVRRIDIDPEDVWINYGHEIIGKIEVSEDSSEASVGLKIIGTKPVIEEIATQEAPKGAVTGFTIGELFNMTSLSIILSLVTLVAVIYLIFSKRKR